MRRVLPLAVLLLAAAFVLASRPLWPAAAQVLPACPFRTLLHLPCPSCGSTRALLALGQGQLGVALAANPLFVLVLGLMAAAACLWLGALALGRPLPPWVGQLERSWPPWLRLAVASALVVNWLWLVASTPN